MKAILFAVGALLLTGTAAALAADLPSRAPPPPASFAPPPAYSWTGVYGGLQGGFAWGTARQTDPSPFDSGRFDISGGLVGATLGYNVQFNNFVVGLEGDGSAAWIGGSTTGNKSPLGPCGGSPSKCRAEIDALGTVRGRAGLAFGSIMPFVSGGVAIGSVHGKEGDVLANGAVGSGSTTAVGWTAGAGVEWMFSPNWSTKVEYLHVDLGKNKTFTDTLASGATVRESVDTNADVVRAGFNYKFY
jgi:outer membrane immunogenic protein